MAGAPHEARWIRPEPRRTLTVPALERLVHTAFPRARLVEAQLLADGLRNSNFKVQLDTVSECIVVRIYEHDASLCQKEVDLIHLVAGSVPVAEVIHAEPVGIDDLPPFALLRYVEGITFRDLKRSADHDAIAQAAYSAGETLAAIARITFPAPGWLGPGPSVAAALLEGENPIPRFVDLCLESTNSRLRLPAGLRDRIHSLVWSWAPQFEELGQQTRLVHGDFGKRNLLVRNICGRWSVAAVLDWEFAISGSPLADLGHFLRYERTTDALLEPHFSDGYARSGGTLPREWRRLARLLDLTALCESLTHDQLPDAITGELVELVCATVENRDPVIP